ncbi:hypothetical protein [Ruminococcus sp. YE71]|uniref:hypothetical protein n=1 Tax=Ruminococcus sp. YE71 TaxID=244362 RepID=UPI001A9A59DB|nr:hypothetical protein [Ruminococcus sp. YE71]
MLMFQENNRQQNYKNIRDLCGKNGVSIVNGAPAPRRSHTASTETADENSARFPAVNPR